MMAPNTKHALFVFAVLLTARCAWGTCTTGPPCFTTQPSSTFVYEEDQYGNATSLELACEAEGVPSPTISWYRAPSGGEEVEVDGGLVTENGTRLVVPGITDDGVYASRAGVSYHCRASNAFGTIRSQPAIVTYAYFDGFTGPAGTKVIDLETLDDVAMECDVGEAFPEPAIQWVDQDGAVVVEQTGPPAVRLLNGGRFLAFASLTNAINGSRYRCRVTNALGFQTNDSSVEYQLIVGDNTGVPVNLTIFKPLEDVTARVGDEEVLFSIAVAKGGSPATYSYTFGGVPVTISGAGPYATLVEPVELADDGREVACMVYSMQFTANLRVIEDVDVGDPPSDDLNNFVADPKSFSCQPTRETPQPSVDWYHNGGPLPEGVVSSGFSIDIASMELAHKGMYQCLLTNEANSVLYSWALDVREPKAPEVVTGLSPGVEIVADEGQPLLLNATVSADPAPSLAKWFFNGTNIANTSATQDSADPSLYTASYIITSLSASSTGFYYATFVNRAGSVSAAPVFVSPPVAAEVFQLQLVNATCLEEGNTALLVCEGYGRPIPNYEFLKDNERIVSDERIAQNGNTLEITGIQQTDEGVYSCQSYNDVGGVTQTSPSVSDSRDLQYCSAPSVSLVSSDESNTFTEGSDAVLTCTASGTPIDSIVWSMDGAPVNKSLEHIDINVVGVGQSELEFRPIQLSDKGTYKCEVSNDVGQDSAEVTITVNKRPAPLPLFAYVLIGVGVLILIAIVVLLLCCALCATYRQGRKAQFPVAMGTLSGDVMADYPDGRGNVDVSDEEGETGAEAFNPEYESLPALRPAQPPQYKPTPSYPHGAPLQGDDIELTKVPPPDTDEYLGTSYPKQDNGSFVGGYTGGGGGRAAVEDFVSEDAQFV